MLLPLARGEEARSSQRTLAACEATRGMTVAAAANPDRASGSVRMVVDRGFFRAEGNDCARAAGHDFPKIP